MSEKVSEDVHLRSPRPRDWPKLKGTAMRVHKRGRRIGDKVRGAGSEGVDAVLLPRFNHWHCLLTSLTLTAIASHRRRPVPTLTTTKTTTTTVSFADLGASVQSSACGCAGTLVRFA